MPMPHAHHLLRPAKNTVATPSSASTHDEYQVNDIYLARVQYWQ